MPKKFVYKPKKNRSLRTITGVFFTLAMLIVGLAVVSISKNATQQVTSTATQAYGGYKKLDAGELKLISAASSKNPDPRPDTSKNPDPKPADTSKNRDPQTDTSKNPDPKPDTSKNPDPDMSKNPDPVKTGDTIPFTGDSIPLTGDTIPFEGDTIPFTGDTISQNPQQPTGDLPTSGGSSMGQSNNSGGSSSNSNKDKDDSKKQDPAKVSFTPMQCKEHEVLNVYFRNNIGYARVIPMDNNGIELKDKATDYWEVLDLNKNPTWMAGKGDVQAYHAYIHPRTSDFVQYLVRNQKLYVKVSKTNKGLIDWDQEARTPWIERNDFGPAKKAPGPRDVTAFGTYFFVLGGADKTVHMREYIQKAGKSYYNDTVTVTYNSANQYVSSNYGEYREIADFNANPNWLPGEGFVTGQGDYIDPFGKYLYQDYWRGSTRYQRAIPLINGNPDYSKAGRETLKAVQNVNDIKGSGPIQAMTNYVVCKSI